MRRIAEIRFRKDKLSYECRLEGEKRFRKIHEWFIYKWIVLDGKQVELSELEGYPGHAYERWQASGLFTDKAFWDYGRPMYAGG